MLRAFYLPGTLAEYYGAQSDFRLLAVTLSPHSTLGHDTNVWAFGGKWFIIRHYIRIRAASTPPDWALFEVPYGTEESILAPKVPHRGLIFFQNLMPRIPEKPHGRLF